MGKQYTCSICGKTDEWDEATWAWFGSILDMDAGRKEKIIVTCSANCRDELCRWDGTIPPMKEVVNG